MSVIGDIGFEIDREDLIRRLSIDTDDEDDMAVWDTLVDTANKVGNPKVLYAECLVDKISNTGVVIDGVEFVSAALSNNLLGVERCYPYVTTCGAEMDGVELPEDCPVVGYWWDEIKNIMLMAARRHFNTILREEYKLEQFSSMAPGSADVDVWMVEEQKKLFSLFECGGEEVGVELTESCLMLPNKTLSGIAFISEKDFLSCQLCQRDDCTDRKISFDESLYQIMHGE